MTDLVRVGAVARPLERADAERQVRTLREAVEPSLPEREEAEQLLADYKRGRWRPVRLELFADMVGEGARVERFDSVHVEGVWFRVPHDQRNERHAQEAADQSFDRLQSHLIEEGFDIRRGQLESMPFVLELDARLGAG